MPKIDEQTSKINAHPYHVKYKSFYKSVVRPLLFRLPPELVHEFALHSLPLMTTARVLPSSQMTAMKPLQRFGLTFKNPVGLAAGFDKNGIALRALASLGFGHIEAGTVTYQSQPGNPKPRLFRLPEDRALINRAGFNNEGAEAFAKRIKDLRLDCVLGVSIGRSRAASDEETIEDYLKCFRTVRAVSDYIAVNVSSPNTPGLRDLQKAQRLEALLSALQSENRKFARTSGTKELRLLVKVAPDLNAVDLETIVDVCRRHHIDGLIATNTTISRTGLKSSSDRIGAYGAGGLSGAPLRDRSTEMIADLYRLTSGSIKIIGVGGIFSATDAWEKIRAGASLVQLYTGFIYEGPNIANRINEGIAAILRREGLDSIDEAVGTGVETVAR